MSLLPFTVGVFIDHSPLLVLRPGIGEMPVDRLLCEARPRCVVLVFDCLEPRWFCWETHCHMVILYKCRLCFELLHALDGFVGQ